MSTPAEYVRLLIRNGVNLWVDNGQLRYHAKKGVLSSEELARLRTMRSEIIAELTRAAEDSTPATAASEVRAPLSFQQRWLLKLMEEHPGWKATQSHAFHLKGVLDPAALESSFAGLFRMHASLRTRMVRVRRDWRQQTEAIDRFQLPIIQSPGATEAERRQNALLLIQESEARELDPAVAALIAAQLIRVAAQEHFLVIRVHRLATDCLGFSQVVRDLWSLYTQGGQPPALMSLEGSLRYLDYARRQDTTDAAWRQKHEPYWNDYLAVAQRILWPMKENASPLSRDASGVLMSLESSFGETLSAGLRELGRQTQTLPALITLTLYVVCVSLRCGQRDFIVPFQITGRAAAHEGIVGCFSHVVYLRIRLNGGERFTEALKVVSNEFYRAAAFRRDSGRMALEKPELLRGTFCQWLSWDPRGIAGLRMDEQTCGLELQVEKIRCHNLQELTNVPPEMVDLEINFFDAHGDISALAIYRTERFAEADLVRLMRELRSAAEQAVRD